VHVHHFARALRSLWQPRNGSLGIIESAGEPTKRSELEDEDALMRRIEDASNVVPIERLALSTQCGFASTMEGNNITEDAQRKKLALVVRVAERVWGHA